MLLPEPELPDPLLPWDAELPDCPDPEAEPLPELLPLWAMAKAAETTKIASIWSKRFIRTISSLLVQADYAFALHSEFRTLDSRSSGEERC